MEFLENLEPLLKSFWYIAIPTSVVFVLQTVMSFVGGGDTDFDTDIDSDFDSDSADFQLLTIRNLINFLLGFSWTGISFYGLITNSILLVLVSLAVGSFFVYIFWLIMKLILRFSEDNSFKIEEALYKSGEVYLSIPEARTGKGKIIISVKGSTRELDAMTESSRINTGEKVSVIGLDQNILIVEKT